MFSKLLAVAQTKVGAALVAAALVAGGGTAVAVTATHGNLPLLGSHISGNGSSSDHSGTPEGESGDKSHHLSVEGILKSYTAPSGDCSSASASASSVTPGSASVLPEDASSSSEDQSHSSTPEAEGTHTSSQPAASQSPVSIEITCDTKVNGDHASSLADLAGAVGHKVQVQASQQNGAWVASKVTVESASSDSSGDSHEGQEPTETPGSSHEGQEPTEVPDHQGTPSPEATGAPDH